MLAFKSSLCSQYFCFVLPHTYRNYLQNYLLPCFKHTFVVWQQRNPKENPIPPTAPISATPFVAVSFHSHSSSSIKITLKKEIYYSPCVCTASNTRLIDDYMVYSTYDNWKQISQLGRMVMVNCLVSVPTTLGSKTASLGN